MRAIGRWALVGAIRTINEGASALYMQRVSKLCYFVSAADILVQYSWIETKFVQRAPIPHQYHEQIIRREVACYLVEMPLGFVRRCNHRLRFYSNNLAGSGRGIPMDVSIDAGEVIVFVMRNPGDLYIARGVSLTPQI